MQKKLQIRMQKLIQVIYVSPEIINTPQIDWEIIDGFGDMMIRGIWKVATLEEPIGEYPADWWQAFKERWFPLKMRGKYPIRMTKIIARHKFPDYDPNIGREYIDVFKKE